MGNSNKNTQPTTLEWSTFSPDGNKLAMKLTSTTGTKSSSQSSLRERDSMRERCALSSPGSLMALKSREDHSLRSSQKLKSGCSITTTQREEQLLRPSEWSKCQ